MDDVYDEVNQFGYHLKLVENQSESYQSHIMVLMRFRFSIKPAGEFEIAYNYDFDSGIGKYIGKYIGKDTLTLKKGTYYFVVEYEPNPMDDAWGTKYSFKIRK